MRAVPQDKLGMSKYASDLTNRETHIRSIAKSFMSVSRLEGGEL